MRPILAWLAIAQVIGWGTVGLPTVAGSVMAADLGLSLSTIFVGPAIFYGVMGLFGPVLSSIFVQHGARRVMLAGALLAVPAFTVLGTAVDPVTYVVSWILLGTSGAAMLSTGAYIFLNEVLGRSAKQAIGTLMLATGLSSSIFLPVSAVLVDSFGWRLTCFAYAAAILCICVPIYGLALRQSRELQAHAPSAAGNDTGSSPTSRLFYLMAAAISLNAFVTFGLAAIIIEMLKAYGTTQAQAVALGSLLGVVQVAARALDAFGGSRWDGLTTGIVAGALLIAGLAILLALGGGPIGLTLFVLAYGLGSGALAVARATIPLAFFDKDAYARATSKIALPLNLLAASAPPVMAAILTSSSVSNVLVLCIACATIALTILLVLARRVGRSAES